jgi:hypothetical protein
VKDKRRLNLRLINIAQGSMEFVSPESRWPSGRAALSLFFNFVSMRLSGKRSAEQGFEIEKKCRPPECLNWDHRHELTHPAEEFHGRSTGQVHSFSFPSSCHGRAQILCFDFYAKVFVYSTLLGEQYNGEKTIAEWFEIQQKFFFPESFHKLG